MPIPYTLAKLVCFCQRVRRHQPTDRRAVIDGNDAALRVNYEYDAYHQISAQRVVDRPDNDEVYEYDPLGHLQKVTAEYGRLTYGYDAVGNRTNRLMERQDPATQAWSELYS